MRSILRSVLPRSLWTACVSSLVLHALVAGVLWKWQLKAGTPVAPRPTMRVRLVRPAPTKVAQAEPPSPVKEPPKQVEPPPSPPPAPKPPHRPKPPEKTARVTLLVPRTPEEEAPLPQAASPPEPAPPPPPQQPKPVVMPPPAPPPPAPPAVPPKLPEPTRPRAADKQTLVAQLLDRSHDYLRRDYLSQKREQALWLSTRSYGDEEAGNVVAQFGQVRVTRKQVEDAFEQLNGVRLREVEQSPAEARKKIEALVGALLLPEVEVAEAEKRGYATKPGIRMDQLCAAVVTSDEIQQFYTQHKDLYGSKSQAEAWSEIREVLLAQRLDESRKAFEADLARMRQAAQVVTHFELLSQPHAPDEAALFEYNGQAYTMAQWRAELATLKPPPKTNDEKRRHAEALLDRVLMLSSTAEVKDRQLRDSLESERRANLVRLLRQEEVEAKVNPTEAEQREYYAKIRSNLEVTGLIDVGWLVYRFAPGEQGANQAKSALTRIRSEVQAGGDFDKVADKYAAAPPYQKGRRQYPISESLPIVFDGLPAAVRRLPEGATSEPFVYAREGCAYLFHMHERKAPRTMTYKEAEDLVQEELWEQQYDQRLAEFRDQLLATADIKYNEATLTDMVRRATARHGKGGATSR